ncbi:MAG: hypothetical protein KC425_15925, partial [Anaerolineales bacterium]|nr:hypothetical protein [Anaerolineales bacterium]
MTYPSESDILLMKKKEQVLRPEKPAGLPLWLLLLLLLPVGGVILAWALAPIRAARPIPYVPATLVSAHTPTPTWQPTPTLKPTSAELTVWNLFPTETPAVSAVETAVSPTTSPATAAPTQTPFPTWTPAATATPWPTHTPQPTFTLFPTWTPAATWTPQAT